MSHAELPLERYNRLVDSVIFQANSQTFIGFSF